MIALSPEDLTIPVRERVFAPAAPAAHPASAAPAVRSPGRVAEPRRRRRSVLLAQAWWQERILRGVASYAAKHDWELHALMHWTHTMPSEWRGDGIIAYAGISEWMKCASRDLISFVRSKGAPVVDLQAFGDAFGAPRVRLAHDAIGALAAEHFLRLNYQHFGYVLFDENPLETTMRQGFQRTAEAAGRRFHALTPQILSRGLSALPKPMALFAMNDPNALRVMMICRDAGYHVPEEFAVMGVDDTAVICDLAAVPLTSIDPGMEEQGYQAAALLDRLMNAEKDVPACTTIAPKTVIVRQSTDLVAIPDLDVARVLRSIRDRFREQVNVQQIVDDLNVRIRRVHAGFRIHVGCTMLQELTRLRIEYAQKLFADPKLKLDAIATESGFTSRFHFVKAFRRVTGMTPKQYRLRNRTSS